MNEIRPFHHRLDSENTTEPAHIPHDTRRKLRFSAQRRNVTTAPAPAQSGPSMHRTRSTSGGLQCAHHFAAISAFDPTEHRRRAGGELTSAHPRDRVLCAGAGTPAAVLRINNEICGVHTNDVSGPQLIPSRRSLMFFPPLSAPGPAHCHACPQSRHPGSPSAAAQRTRPRGGRGFRLLRLKKKKKKNLSDGDFKLNTFVLNR